MEIVIAHSHLNPGGVTRIIESQVVSITNLKVSVLVGSIPEDETKISSKTKVRVLPGLNYLENRKYSDKEALILLHQIHTAIKRNVPRNAILHFHNLNLGKNPIVTYAVYLLAKEGYSIFNHAHDFAEDRPSNFRFIKEIISNLFLQKTEEVMYPKLSNYHFGVLNSFDYKRLLSYGVEKERIEWLPNPVTFSLSSKNLSKQAAKSDICRQLGLINEKLLVSYPVRVIKRKNIGEFILLGILFKDEANFVVTQAPKNPKEIELYSQWVAFCASKEINLTFEAGTKVNFEKLLIASDFCITTSYKEGFGMVYLEPWLVNTPVVGRDIDFITKDFMADGFEFSILYKNVKVAEKTEDFKNLTMKHQMEIISDVLKGKIKKTDIFNLNPLLKTIFNNVSKQTIDKNKTIIKNNYSLEGYGIKLQNRYKKILGQTS